jgi:putative ABC transport system permease protein
VSSWLVALRIARREARRAKGRSVLVVALIGLPVLGLTFAAVTYDMFRLTPAERVEREIGAADARLQWAYDDPVRQSDVRGYELSEAGMTADRQRGSAEVTAALPPGSRVLPYLQGRVWLETAGGEGELPWHAVDLTDPLTTGLARVTAGRAPRPGEVALTGPAVTRLGLAVGGSLDVGERSYPVAGLVEFPGLPGPGVGEPLPGLRSQVMLFHPDDRPAGGWVRWLADTPEPVGRSQINELNDLGIVVYSRALASDPNVATGAAPGPAGRSFQTGVVVAGLAAIQIVLLAGPAFAVGARRRQRDLALVAASGGTPAHLRRIVLADGVVLGGAAAAIGLLLGGAAALVARGPAAQSFGALPGGYRFFPAALAGVVGFAVVTGVLAALVPAFTAARQQVVAALAGRRGARGFRRRWLVTGLVVAALGALIAGYGAWQISAILVVAGLVLGQLGLALCTPAVIGLVARLGDRLPLAPRIALRDTARNRAAAAPAISAVMAAVAGAVTVGVMVASEAEQITWSPPYPPGTVTAGIHDGFEDIPAVNAATVEQVARDTLPIAEVHQVASAACQVEEEEAGCLVVIAAADERRCPYQQWDESDPLRWTVPPLSSEQQRAASRDPRCDGNPGPVGYGVYVDDGAALAAITGATGADLAAATSALRERGAVVVTDARYLDGAGAVTLLLVTVGPDGTGSLGWVTTLPGHVLDSEVSQTDAVVPYGALRDAGLDANPDRVVMTTTRLPTQAEEDAFVAAVRRLDTWGTVWRPGSWDANPVLIVLGIAAGLIALGAAGIATGLAAADRRADLSTLGVVGASPRIRSGMSLSQSGVIAGLGTLLGLATGLGASVAVLSALNQRYAGIWPSPLPIPITVPWTHLLALLAIPVVAMLGAGLLTRSRLPVERRTT